jgi:hypothetical protein
MGDIRRRAFIPLLGGAAGWPRAARALHQAESANNGSFVAAFRKGPGRSVTARIYEFAMDTIAIKSPTAVK